MHQQEECLKWPLPEAGAGCLMVRGEKTATTDRLLSTCRHKGNEWKPASGGKVEKIVVM